jgi:excisionase family DNA binding protein
MRRTAEMISVATLVLVVQCGVLEFAATFQGGAIVFTVELRFKIANQEVPLERFGEVFLGKVLESLRHDIRQIQIPVPVERPVQREQLQPKRRAVGINEAAELVDLSTATIRKYVAERRIFSVRAGRRILIPMETLDKILGEGVPPPKGG